MRTDEVRFIDSPGFGNELLDDRKILESLVQYLAPDPAKPRYEGINYPDRVTGVVYIHHEGQRFMNRSSQKTMEMLVKVIGEEFLDRLTVLIQSGNNTQGDLSTYSPPQDSPLYPFYCSGTKPRTMIYDDSPQSVERMLVPYTRLSPRLVRLAALNNFMQDGTWQYDSIPRHLKEFFPEDIGPQGSMGQELRLRLREQDNKLEEQRRLLAQKEEEINGLQSIHNGNRNELEELRNLLARKEEEIEGLRSAHDIEQNKLEALRNLFVEKEKEITGLRSTYDTELANIRKERVCEQFNHDVVLGRLRNTIQDQEIEISKLKSSKGSELEKLEASKNEEFSRLSSEKDSEIKRLGEELETKTKEIGKLGLEKYLEIQGLQDEVRAKDEQLVKLKVDREGGIQESTNAAQAKENERMQPKAKAKANGVTTKTENEQGNEIYRLNAEIRRISAEYASLRSHMQLQENTEQADIMTALGDINRLIEEFGESISEHIEKYMEHNSPTKALQPQNLLGLFGQVGNELASKVKQDAYTLFEYAVQATVCDQLHTHLFKPFHPSIADDEKCNTFIMEVYGQMIYQEAQSVAGRWRKDAFNSISRNPAFGTQDKPDDERMHRHITGALSTLLGEIVEIPPHDILKEHDKALSKVITKAEQLNRLLKGEVSLLGDFRPVIFPFGEVFRPDHMTEVSSKPKKPKKPIHPDTILATIGLGLIRSYAPGGNRKPEEIVLCRAVVFGLPK
ncbi:hypothetical protein FRC11_005637 [Ceratobasidium sp. 423]|nr:hypothetical protein FRC11_005637 [Ceratobasidium sp. 423]